MRCSSAIASSVGAQNLKMSRSSSPSELDPEGDPGCALLFGSFERGRGRRPKTDRSELVEMPDEDVEAVDDAVQVVLPDSVRDSSGLSTGRRRPRVTGRPLRLYPGSGYLVFSAVYIGRLHCRWDGEGGFGRCSCLAHKELVYE